MKKYYSKHNKKRKNKKSGGKSFFGFAAVSVLLIAGIIALIIFLTKKSQAKSAPKNTNSVIMVSSLLSKGSNSNSNSNLNGNNSYGYNTGNTVSSTNAAAVKNNNYPLTVVNKNNPLNAGYVPSLGNITAQYTNPLGLQFDSRAISYLNNMLSAAHQKKINLMVISAYCPYSKQLELYNDEVKNQQKSNPNFSKTKAEEEAAKIVEKPTTSEMQLGLSVYFNEKSTSFEKTDEFKWLKENAQNYGFVLRYSSNKTTITGKEYMPYCWRFVGTENAKKMNEKNLSLEEFVNS